MKAQGGFRPLSGIRVVDLSDSLPGVQATQFLADNGAEVIHVERPGGCSLRGHPAYPALGRGKRSIVLDLKDDADREVGLALAGSADVVVECFRPGVVDRLGLGYEAVAAVNPGVVYTSISGWGHAGPYAHVRGYEGLVAARLGAFDALERLSRRPGPSFWGSNAASYGAMHAALQGTLAALLERERSGVGQHVETSLAMGLASLEVWNWALRMVGERFPDAFQNTGPYSPAGVPQSPIFFRLFICMTRDGRWLQFSQQQPRLFRAFMRAVDLEWMFDDPEWSTVPDFPDEAKRVRFWELLLQRTRQKSLADWEAIFARDNNVFAEVYRTGAKLLDHPQIVHNGQATVIEDPVLGPVRQPAPLVRFLDDPITLDRSAPALDEQGREVRAELAPQRAATSAPSEHAPAGRLPLEGVTVLELAYFFAAPYGATLLTDLGARVIKIEPLEGDPIRNQLSFPEVTAMHVLQGKESVAVDLKTPEGQAVVRQLAARADILLTSFRPGTMDRLGIGAAALREVNPQLVVMNAMGYGIDGPYADKPAFAPSISAGSGIAMRNVGSVQASPDLPMDVEKAESVRLASSYPGMGNPDGFSSTSVASGLLLGLLARARTGQSPRMLTSMLGTSAHVLADQMIDYRAMGEVPHADEDLLGLSARYRLYEAAAGWVFLAVPDERQWEQLAAAMGPEAQLADDVRFVDAACRAEHDADLAVELEKAFRARTAAEWEERLLAADIGCVALPGQESEYVFQGELGRASGYLAPTTHPMVGDYDRGAPAMAFSRSATRALGGCFCGQHTRAVLHELGYDDDAIDELAGRGVVGLT